METKEVFCYHHLHNMAHGKSAIERVSDTTIRTTLPDSGELIYELSVDVRDPRVLVCFDGDIPSGGLPKGSTVVSSWAGSPIFCRDAKVYKQRSPDEDSPLYTITDCRAEQKLYRRFVLLQTSRAIFRKYKADTLQPKYLIVDVHDGFVEFSTSSY